MIGAEARTLMLLVRGQPHRGTHAQRLQAFYAPQAGHYDAFRERLLLALRAGDRVVELGGGTGRNLLYFGERLAQLGRVEVVDLCPPLLAEARRRAAGSRAPASPA